MKGNRFATVLALALCQCGDEPTTSSPVTEAEVRPACDPDLRPVIMLHGFLASGDTWAPFAQRFMANGYCPDHIVAFDWDTVSRLTIVDALDARIDALLAATGHTQVDLIGHSAGGGMSYQYMTVRERAAKVASYAHIASSQKPLSTAEPGLPGPADAPVSTLNLTSSGDTVVEGGEIPGAINLVLPTEDHYQAATSDRAFSDVYAFFNAGKKPKTTDLEDAPPLEDAPRIVSGKAVTLAENVPVAGWTIAIYAVAPETGARLEETPEATFTVAEDGSWGPFEAKADTRYEFHLTGLTAEDRSVHYYREPFSADNPLVYLRALPSPGSLAGVLFSSIPFREGQSVLIAFSSSQAVVHGRDTLTVAGETLSTPELASAERTSIAFFLFDENEDNTPGEEVSSFSNIVSVFLTALDRVLPVSPEPLTLDFNGRKLATPRWDSSRDGAIVAIFD